MKSIEKQATKTFQINLEYFSKNHPALFEKISFLNIAINNKEYQEKYALEYKDGYFDVLELTSNNYLYNQNSIEHAKTVTKNVNYKKSESVIEGFYNIRHLSDNEVEIYDDKIDIDNNLFATARLIEYNKRVTSKNDSMKDMLKYIFCGVGLGLHIPLIQQKTNTSLLFIMEDNLELFRLSLFTTDYQELAKKATLFFTIAYDANNFYEFSDFFTQGYTHNHYIKYTMFTDHDIEKVKLIQNSIVRSRHHIRPYAKHIKELLKAPEYLVENKAFLNLREEPFKSSELKNKPILLIGGGPSLENNALWLQNNQDKFIIVAVLSAIMSLHKLQVTPDIVTNIDANEHLSSYFHGIDAKEFLQNSNFIFSSVVATNIIKAMPKREIFFIETAGHYKDSFHVPPAPSIGEITYALLLLLGVNEMYLLGLDLALDPETKSDHSKEHVDFREVGKDSQIKEEYTSFKDTIFYTKGNFLPEVPTTAVYHMSENAFHIFSKRFLTQNQKVFNLNNGAFLQGATPLHTLDLDCSDFIILDKQKEHQSIKTFLQDSSLYGLNESEIKNFDSQIKEAQRLFDLVNTFKTEAKTTNFNLYMQDFYPLYQELIGLNNEKEYDINNIFSIYLQTIIDYIVDIFNTRELQNEAEHTKNIHLIYVKQLLKILNLYIITMRVYQEWIHKEENPKR